MNGWEGGGMVYRAVGQFPPSELRDDTQAPVKWQSSLLGVLHRDPSGQQSLDSGGRFGGQTGLSELNSG